MGVEYDFSGWATRNDVKCDDGRTIRKNAFKECDGKTVPLVWSHIHDDPEMVLGHGILKNEPEGVRIYGKLNDSPKGRHTRMLIESGDIVGLSIWANQLKETRDRDVLHGSIREVSVVLAGANPGAYIDNVFIAHGAEGGEDEAIISLVDEPIEINHDGFVLNDEDFLSHVTDDEEEEEEEKEEPKEEKKPESQEGDKEMAEEKKENPTPEKDEDDETVEDVWNSLSEKQKTVVYAIMSEAMKDNNSNKEDEEPEEEEEEVKHNVFDTNDTPTTYISHDDMKDLMANAKRLGSLREAVNQNIEEGGVLAHAVYNHDAEGNQTTEQKYGMADVNYLFPDARLINNPPEFIKRDDAWVSVVLSGTHHTPFSRIKSVFANITNDEARAKGYIKGKQKATEVFSLLKRSTDPQTIYKLQKMDRDDVLDITDFDVIAWLKGEMRMMLNEEIARAVLVGDGRLTSDDAHISEDHVRPIAKDADLYTIKADVTAGTTTEETAKNMIKAAIRARKDYKGSGTPILFTSESWLTEMMLIEDQLGHPLYADEAALARRMRVSRIVSCPVLDNLKIDGKDLYGIIVNLADYNIGADKGGEINMFDDFDLDFNKQEYLIETRISGALTRPYSAIVLKAAAAAATEGNDEP